MKRILLKLYLTALAAFCGANANVWGQLQEVPSYMPAPMVYSPQAVEMMRYDAIPVNMSTGRINLTIPLIDINDKDFNFPITLNYNSDGFKPTEPDNFVGRNWSLRCGGMIYRQVRGIPDDISDHTVLAETLAGGGGQEYQFDGFMKVWGNGKFNMNEMRDNITKNPYKYASCKDEFVPMPTITNTRIESAPDMYYFNFGEHSGKFMINYDGTVSVTGYDGHQYEVDLSDYRMATSLYARSTLIHIKTDDGYVYTFGGADYGPVEYSAASWTRKMWKPGYQAPTGYDAFHKHTVNAWYLSEIQAPNGRRLTIHYKEIDENFHRDLSALFNINLTHPAQWEEIATLYSLSGYAAYETPQLQGLPPHPGDLYAKRANAYSFNLNKVALIDYITVGSCRVDFHYSLKKQFTGLSSNIHPDFNKFRGAQLDSVSMSYDGKVCQTHTLGYTYQCANRLFLTSLQHAQRGTYQFEYHMPGIDVLPTTANIDHWGYWTGGSADREIMPGTRYAQNNVTNNDFKVTTANREPSPRDYNATLLHTVIYPTGGKSTFEYEPHKYTYMYIQNADTHYEKSLQVAPGGEAVAGGARIKAIQYYDETSGTTVKETRYGYADDSGMEGILTYMPSYRCVGLYLENETTLIGLTHERSNGIGRQFDPSQHIIYPAVTEYYIDPKRGTTESGSPCKQTLFFTGLPYTEYTDFAYNTYQKAEFNPYRYTFRGRPDLVSYHTNRFRWPGRSEAFKNGKVLQESYFDSQHNLKKHVIYQYKDKWRQDYGLCIYTESLLTGSFYAIYTHANKEFFGMSLLARKTVTEYDENYHSTSQNEWYDYDDQGYLTRQTKLLSKGDSLSTGYKYLQDVPALVTDTRQTLHRPGKEPKDIQSEHIGYRLQSGLHTNVPWHVTSEYDSGTDPVHLEKKVKYLKYDSYGNPVEIEKNGLSTIYIWGYDGQYLVAKIENATYEEVTGALDGNRPEVVSDEADYKVFGNRIEGLRNRLPKAHVANYTYQPGVGMTSSTDPSGKTVYFEYDMQGRLVQNYRTGTNGAKEILQLNEYHIVNE